MARRRSSSGRRKSNSKQRSLRYRWKKKTRAGGKYSHLAAVVRRRPGKRKHVKGHAWTGRKGSVALFSRKTGKLWGTNPRKGKRGHRRNPGLVGEAKALIVSPVMDLPKSIPALFKGSLVRNGAWAAGGAVAGLVGGTALQSALLGVAGGFLPDSVKLAMSKGIVQRIVGASFALLAGGVVAKFAVKPGTDRTAFVTGTAAAAVIEAIFPGALATRLHSLPIIGGWINVPASPVSGLAGLFGSDELAAYVESPAYQGVGAYVSSPAYQGVGAYVSSPAYQGVGHLGSSMDDAVAGLGAPGDQLAGNLGAIGSNMPSHLDT